MNLTLANTPARTGRGGGFALTYGMNRAARITTIIMLVLVTLLAINALAVAFTPAHALKLTPLAALTPALVASARHTVFLVFPGRYQVIPSATQP